MTAPKTGISSDTGSSVDHALGDRLVTDDASRFNTVDAKKDVGGFAIATEAASNV